MPLGWGAAASPRRNTRFPAGRFDPLAKGITIVTVVSDDLFLLESYTADPSKDLSNPALEVVTSILRHGPPPGRKRS
jgi:hypothetical protein